MTFKHLKQIPAFFGFGIVAPSKEEVRVLVVEKANRVAGSKAERFTRGNVSAQKGAFITKAQLERELKHLFRHTIRNRIGQFLSRYEATEEKLKKAELTVDALVIPAVNELRYAGRQLVKAVYLLSNTKLSEKNRSDIDRCVTLAEQYLLNADHDLNDALILYFNRMTYDANLEFGQSSMAMFFPEYTLFVKKVRAGVELTVESRGNISKRIENYERISEEIIPFLIEHNDKFIDSYISAITENKRLQAEIKKAQGRINLIALITIIGTAAGLIGIWFGYFAWHNAASNYCVIEDGGLLRGTLCKHLRILG